jgi:hypothetical protein
MLGTVNEVNARADPALLPVNAHRKVATIFRR